MENLTKQLNSLSLHDYNKYLNETHLSTLNNISSYLEDIYYNTGESQFEDYRYDLLKNFLANNTDKVGAPIREGENRCELPYWLGSADKITPEEPKQFQKWISENKSYNYVISSKLDGVSCLLVYKNNQKKLFTRGDGTIGADISHLAKYINIPKLKENISVRGELIIPKNTFNKKHKDKYKNPRNMVSGLISRKTFQTAIEDIHFVVYEIIDNEMYEQSKQLEKLDSLGFEVVQHEIIQDINLSSLSDLYIDFTDNSPYELDGLIVQSNTTYKRNTSGNPDYMFAFKMNFSDAIYETKVKSIEWNISKWGQLKPVVIIEPIQTSGITMSRATANHAKYIVENNLGPGSMIKVTRSKEVIPYIVEVIKQSSSPQLPDVPYIWDKNKVNITVKNHDNIMCIKLLAEFFAKLKIKHVSEATISKMFDNGLDNLIKIISADKSRLLQVPEFQEKSAERIYTNIRNGLKDVKITTLLGASGVLGYGIGIKKIDSLLTHIPDLFSKYKNKTEKEIISMITDVEGFSDITAKKISSNLKYGDQLLQKLNNIVTFKTEEKISDILQNHKIVMTGFRDQNLSDEIIKRGGKILDAISKNVTILIVKDFEKTSTKLQKAQELDIKIYSKEAFQKEYGI
jgi:DNA ligase (NAD+)